MLYVTSFAASVTIYIELNGSNKELAFFVMLRFV